MALEQAAFEQQPFAVDLDEIHGAGGSARRAEEMDFHVAQRDAGCGKLQSRFRRRAAGSNVPVGDACLVEVVGRHLDVDLVAVGQCETRNTMRVAAGKIIVFWRKN
jgi:hypothetical protein